MLSIGLYVTFCERDEILYSESGELFTDAKSAAVQSLAAPALAAIVVSSATFSSDGGGTRACLRFHKINDGNNKCMTIDHLEYTYVYLSFGVLPACFVW